MLVAAKIVTEAQVQEALARQKGTGKRLGEVLVELGYVTELQVTQSVSNQLSIPWVNLYHVDFSRELLELVPAALAESLVLVPVYVREVRKQGRTLFCAMQDPLNLDALQRVADASGLPVKPMVAAPTDIRNAIRVYYLGLPPEETKKRAAVAKAAAKPAPPDPEVWIEQPPSEPERESAVPSEPVVKPSVPPKKPTAAAMRFLTLTLLDGTTVRLPSPGSKSSAQPSAQPASEERPAERGLTTRDLIHALTAKAAGEDVSDVLPDDAWEPLFAALLSTLMRKGLVADWEFVDEWKKHRKKD